MKSIVVYSSNMIYEFQWTNETLLYKNLSLVLFSKGAHSLLLVWDIDGETYTQREDFFLPHILFLWPVGANPCTPLQAVSPERPETPLIGCVSLARLSILCTLNLISWLSRGLRPLTHLLDLPTPPLLSPSSLIPKWQLVKAHGVTRNEPKIHVICYITVFNPYIGGLAVSSLFRGYLLEMNVIDRLEFELAYYDVTVQHVSHYPIGTLLSMLQYLVINDV